MRNDWQIININSCPSTNTLLKEQLINGDSKVGTVLITKEQTHGRGRYDRIWVAPPGNLCFSLAVQTPQKAEKVYQLNLIAALSLVRTIRQLYYIDVKFKWPNDVIINNLKLAGILSESVLQKNTAIIGIGLNLNSLPNNFPEDLRSTLTTLKHETGSMIDQKTFLNCFLEIFSQDLDVFFKEGLNAFQSELHSCLAWKNTNVRIIESEDQQYLAKILHMDGDGFLLVATTAGEIRRVVAGDVRLA